MEVLQQKVKQMLSDTVQVLAMPSDLQQIVMGYAGCDFNLQVSCSDWMSEKTLDKLFVTTSGILVAQMMHDVEVPAMSAACPEETSTYFLHPERTHKGCWLYSPTFAMTNVEPSDSIISQVFDIAEPRTLQFRTQKTVIPEQKSMCYVCHNKTVDQQKTCWNSHQQRITEKQILDFDTKEILDLKQVANVYWQFHGDVHDADESGTRSLFSFIRIRAEFPGFYHSRIKNIEEWDLLIPKNLTASIHSDSYACSHDALLLSIMTVHLEHSEQSGLSGIRAYDKETPSQVIFWKRDSLADPFRLQSLLNLSPFLDATEGKGKVCYQPSFLAFTPSKSHLVIAWSVFSPAAASTNIRLLFYDLTSFSVNHEWTFTLFTSNQIVNKITLGSCEGQSIQVLFGYLKPQKTKKRKASFIKNPGEVSKQFLLLNLVVSVK